MDKRIRTPILSEGCEELAKVIDPKLGGVIDCVFPSSMLYNVNVIEPMQMS